jgi:pimeloyl-ACP methyl ester carboxylesterase
MFIREYGSGRAVLMLHGAPSAPTDFDPVVLRLLTTRRVLLPDMPGYGKSPYEPNLSIPRSVELIDQELISRGIEEVSVIGFSMGAWRALLLALDGKTRVDEGVCERIAWHRLSAPTVPRGNYDHSDAFAR